MAPQSYPSWEDVPNSGFWGPTTSTIDWCESNYTVTYFIAEFWNTISNISFIIPPFLLALRLQRDPRTKHVIERPYIWSLYYLALTGVGSLCFHASLKYAMQLYDELCMIWQALLMVYMESIILWPHLNGNKAFQLSLFGYGVIFNVAYMFLSNPLFHEIFFGILAYSLVAMGWMIQRRGWGNPRLFYLKIGVQHLAFFLWNIDNIFCPTLKYLRDTPGSVLSHPLLVPFTQLHAWWHLLMGYASYLSLVFCIQSRVIQKNDTYKPVVNSMRKPEINANYNPDYNYHHNGVEIEKDKLICQRYAPLLYTDKWIGVGVKLIPLPSSSTEGEKDGMITQISDRNGNSDGSHSNGSPSNGSNGSNGTTTSHNGALFRRNV